MKDGHDNKYYAWCDNCHHYPIDHQKSKCWGTDQYGSCNCKKFIPSKELLN